MVVVEKEQTTVKFQVQLYNGPSSNKQPATEVTSQTYTLAPSGAGVKIDSVQALEGQSWTIDSGGKQATVTIKGPSKQVSFSVTATVESSKPGIMGVKFSGQVTLAGGKTLPAASTPPARFSVAAVQYTEYYDNGSTALPKTEDKVVELKRPQQGADLPADLFLKVCKIQLKKPTLVDVNITLKNPNGHLGLFKASVTGLSPTPQGSITLTLPKDGTTAKFKLSGETASIAVNDSKLNAYLNKQNLKNGAASTHNAGDAKFTVFSFGKAGSHPEIETSALRAYQLKKTKSTVQLVVPGMAIKISAEADLLPREVASGNPITRQLSVSIVQNALNGTKFYAVYEPVSNSLPKGVSGYAYKTITLTNEVDIPNSTGAVDGDPYSIPFYQPGIHRPFMDSPGGSVAIGRDGPKTASLARYKRLPLLNQNDRPVPGIFITYAIRRIIMAENFNDWAVVEQVGPTVNRVLDHTSWSVNITIPPLPPGKAIPGSGESSGSPYPVLKPPLANTQIRHPSTVTDGSLEKISN